jgi:alkylation response protein AidB-like acyl-CoA dehydrogenase
LISFELSEEQRIAQSVMADFAVAALRSAARQAEDAEEVSDQLLSALWETGIIQTQATREEPTDETQPTFLNALILEELGRGDATLAVAAAGTLGFVKTVAEQGSSRQKGTILPLFATEQFRAGAVAMMDAGFVQSVAAPRTTAARTADGYVLNGVKGPVPLAARCSHFLVLASCDGTPDIFIVPKDAPNLRIGESKGSLGLRALASAELHLDNVLIGAEMRLGENQGCNVQRVLDSARVALSAILTGLSRAVFDHALPYTKERVVHGEAIAKKQIIAFRLADMYTEIEAMRWMVWRAAVELDKRPTATRNARLAQCYANEQALWIADEGLQMFGGHGFVREQPLEMWYRNARSISVLEGVVGA